MKKVALLLGILFCSTVLISCDKEVESEDGNIVNDNPTPEEILKDNKNADIFTFNGIVYSNSEDVKWVNELDLSLGKKLGEIKKTTKISSEFENFTATKLPVGVEIYEMAKKEGPIVIVVIDDKKIPYLGLIEG